MEGGEPIWGGGLPSSIIFPGFVHMPVRVALGGGSPYLLGRGILLEGPWTAHTTYNTFITHY